MKNVFLLGATLAIALAFMEPVAAQGPKASQGQDGTPPPIIQILKQADANGDGKVTFDELKAVRPKLTEQRFQKLDRNGDGVLTKADLPPRPAQVIARLLKNADKDGNGKVTLEEAQAVAPKMTAERFAKLDRDKDGFLTRTDLPQGPRDQNPARRAQFITRLLQADTNQDGNITLEEAQKAFPKMTPERFKKLDRNGDGVINKDDKRPKPAQPTTGNGA